MFIDASVQIGLWATLSAPVCAAYAAACGNRHASVHTPAHSEGSAWWAGIASCLTLVCVAVASMEGRALATLLLFSGLTYFAVYDLRALAIPVWPVLACIALGIVLPGVSDRHERALAAVAGLCAFLALGALYRTLRGHEGLGEGDALIAALLGAWLSFEGLAWSVAAGGGIGILWALLLRKKANEAMPFVPALAAGACCYQIAGIFLL